MVPHLDRTQQAEFATADSQEIGNISPGTPPANPATSSSTNVPRTPVPCTLSVLFEDVDPPGLTALLEGTPPADSPGTSPLPPPQTCPTCGRAYDLFDHDTSRLLDLVLVSREALSTATAALSTLTHALEEDLP